MTVAKYVLLFLSFSLNVFALDKFSVTSKDVGSFIKRCPGIPSTEQMNSEIGRLLTARQQKPSPTWKDRFRSLFGHSIPLNSNIKSVSLDGLKMNNLNPYDLEVISRLTMYRDSSSWIWKDDYPIEQKQVSGVTQIQRKCLTKTCKDRDIAYIPRFDAVSFVTE